jgi:hypothetical protein
VSLFENGTVIFFVNLVFQLQNRDGLVYATVIGAVNPQVATDRKVGLYLRVLVAGRQVAGMSASCPKPATLR